MATVLPIVRSENLNDFVLGVRYDEAKEDPTDVITPRNPLFKRLTEKGLVETRSPGKGPVEDVIYQTPDRSTVISLSDDLKQQDYTPITVSTQAKYDWVQVLQNLTIPKMEYDNNKGPNQLTDIVKRKMKALFTAQRNKLNYIMWNGIVSGSEKVFGILDLIQFDPTSNPSKGYVGGIDATGTDTTWWRNQYSDYDTAYKTISSGTRTKTFLNDPGSTASLENTWVNCINNADGDMDEGQPDLGVCNLVFWQQFSDLVDERLYFTNKEDKFKLGVDGFWFKSMFIMYDRSVPAAPTSGEGVLLLLNTSTLSFCYAEGLKEDWGPMSKVPGKTGYTWEMGSQIGTTCKARNRNGVFFGTKAASVS